MRGLSGQGSEVRSWTQYISDGFSVAVTRAAVQGKLRTDSETVNLTALDNHLPNRQSSEFSTVLSLCRWLEMHFLRSSSWVSGAFVLLAK